MTAAEILRDLVAIPTPSVLSNRPLIDHVRSFVEARGWGTELFAYCDENGVPKANMIARPAAGDRRNAIDLAFVCHTDTVPYAADWTDALFLQSSDGQSLHGCGACDVKGALACFLAALDGLETELVRKDVALILTADEEVGCKGMERLLGATDLHIRTAIVSEPTSLRPGIAGKGYGLARVTVRGVEAHSAFPTRGVSAIVVAARFITQLEEVLLSRQAGDFDDPLFDPPHTTMNIGVIQGGSAKNIIAGECSFLVEWRPVPREDPRSVFYLIEQLSTRFVAAQPSASLDVELLRSEAGFAAATKGPLQLALHSVTGRPPIGISFGSEAGRLARIANEIIVIGPGDMRTAHSNRECVPVDELEEWTLTLRRLLAAR